MRYERKRSPCLRNKQQKAIAVIFLAFLDNAIVSGFQSALFVQRCHSFGMDAILQKKISCSPSCFQRANHVTKHNLSLSVQSDDSDAQSSLDSRKESSVHSALTDDGDYSHLSENDIAKNSYNDETTIYRIVGVKKDELISWSIVATVLTLFSILMKISGPGSWRYYAAGGICAAFSHGITTPIDVVKTRQQVDPALQGKGVVKSTKKIIEKEGFRTLLSGLGPTTWGYLLEGSIKFGIYEALKPQVRRLLLWAATASSISGLSSKLLGFLLCAGVSGVAASAMICPMEALRIRLVAEPDFAPEGWVHGFLRLLREGGVGGLWRGINAMMLKQVPYTITKNVSFDFIATATYSAVKSSGYALTATMKFYIPLVSAMAASVLSTISSQPGDMLLSVQSAHEGNRSAMDFAMDIKKEMGIKGFFRGMEARFVHVGLIVTVQLLIYDIIKRVVGIAATGSA